ncbi:poly-beta-1,6 N-acetyl-D-glucosamine export porin PgaA, partial [Serratia sp. IR-2025]
MPKVNSRSLRFTERHATKYAASLLFIGLSLPAAALADERYDALIRQARSGDTAPVLAYLSQRRAQEGLSLQQRADYIQVGGGGGPAGEVVGRWGGGGPARPRGCAPLGAGGPAARHQQPWGPQQR